jgi:hypothetical protein
MRDVPNHKERACTSPVSRTDLKVRVVTLVERDGEACSLAMTEVTGATMKDEEGDTRRSGKAPEVRADGEEGTPEGGLRAGCPLCLSYLPVILSQDGT